MRLYKVLSQQVFKSKNYSIVPIRWEDRYLIMKWRNEQIYHLRQNKPLTKEDQDKYFNDVVAQLFNQNQPGQILFSYLEGEKCIGYGGLVHINWVDKNAEISFIMNTSLEKECFVFHWSTYLGIVEQVAFEELGLHKIYTYAFDVRPKLYNALQKSCFSEEAILKEHCFFEGKYIDVLIHSKYNLEIRFRPATMKDSNLLFKWANDVAVRKNSFNPEPIKLKDHLHWLSKRLSESTCKIFIFHYQSQSIGQVRLDKVEAGWLINYSVDSNFRGRGFGTKMINLIKNEITLLPLIAQVKGDNLPSAKVFEKCGFILDEIIDKNKEQVFNYKYSV